MKCIAIFVFNLLIFSQLSAQFIPGDIGYQQTEFEVYKKNNVKAAHFTTLEMDGSMTPIKPIIMIKQVDYLKLYITSTE